MHELKSKEKGYIIVRYEFSHDADPAVEFSNVEEFHGRIMWADLDTDAEKQIGKVELHLYSEIDPNSTIYEALDRSNDTAAIARGLFLRESNVLNQRVQDMTGCTPIPDSFLVVHDIELDPAHRGMGHGKKVMACIERQFAPKCEFFALIAKHANLEMLRKFYKECGYGSMKREGVYYFIKPSLRAVDR